MRVDSEELAQLWELACVLAAREMAPQAIATLEAVLCAAEAGGDCAEEQTRRIAACANALLAEICVVAAPSESNPMDRTLWRKRLARAERCIREAEKSPALLSDDWRCRLLKAKYLLVEVSKVERAEKNRQILEILCAAIGLCAESEARAGESGGDRKEEDTAGTFKSYFLGKLQAHISKLHGASLLAKYPESGESHNAFIQSLEFALESFPEHFDNAFQLWLIEVLCHAYVTSFYFDGGCDAQMRLDAARQYFRSLSERTSVSQEMRVYHLVISAFYCLRKGEAKKMASTLEEIKTLLSAPELKPTGMLQEAYLHSILDGLKLHAMARSDPCEAFKFSTKAIHQVQTNMQMYAQNKSISMMLIAILFDMLADHCRLQAQQCRYYELGLSIVQMLQLFATYKSTLEQTVFYKFFVARCHILIAKYAVVIGKVKETVVNINYVVEKLLPPIAATTTSYPDAYLSVWIDALDVLTYCGNAADPSFAATSSGSSAPQIHQFCPNVVLLEFSARILEMDGLRNLVYHGCSVELRAKYDLALAKWLWGSHELVANPSSRSTNVDLGRHAALENLRAGLLTLLHESLELMGNHVGCSETIAELMALFGPKLLEIGKTEHGEETLKNAMQISLHAKNLLLQTRLLVAIFRLYAAKQEATAQATTVDKYEKKLRLLQKRIAQAQAETARNKLILRWKGGESASSTSAATAPPPPPSS